MEFMKRADTIGEPSTTLTAIPSLTNTTGTRYVSGRTRSSSKPKPILSSQAKRLGNGDRVDDITDFDDDMKEERRMLSLSTQNVSNGIVRMDSTDFHAPNNKRAHQVRKSGRTRRSGVKDLNKRVSKSKSSESDDIERREEHHRMYYQRKWEDSESKFEKIVESKIYNGEEYVRIRWKGYHSRDDTWHNARQLEYEVEHIVGVKIVKGETLYRVRWKDWDSCADTWYGMVWYVNVCDVCFKLRH